MIFNENEYIGDKYLVCITDSNADRIILYMINNFIDLVDFVGINCKNNLRIELEEKHNIVIKKIENIDFEPVLVFSCNKELEEYNYSEKFNYWIYTPSIRDLHES